MCEQAWWSYWSPVAHSCSLLNHPNSSCGGMFKLNAKFGADSLLYSLSHFECNGHTVHMLSEQHLLLPVTSTVKSSLFMHGHSSPLSLAARLHWCHINYSHCINNGWTFSRQTSKTSVWAGSLFSPNAWQFVFWLSYLCSTIINWVWKGLYFPLSSRSLNEEACCKTIHRIPWC